MTERETGRLSRWPARCSEEVGAAASGEQEELCNALAVAADAAVEDAEEGEDGSEVVRFIAEVGEAVCGEGAVEDQ